MSTLLAPAPTRPRTTGIVARWALHLALVAALGTFVVARDDRSALLLLIPLAIAPALRWRRAPRGLVALLPVVARLALLGVLTIAVLSRQLRLVADDRASVWAGALGWTLGILAVVFILGHRIWPVTRTLLPAIVGLLVVSGLKPGVALFPWFAAGGALALWTYAFVQGGPRRIGLPLAVFLLVAGAVAAGTVWFLPWAQPHVERALADAFVEGTTGLAEESRLGEFGRLASSRRVVLRVWTSEARLLRAYVLTRFDGREWTSSRPGQGPPARSPLRPLPGTDAETWLRGVPGGLFVVPPTDGVPAAGDRTVETRIVQSAVDDWPLLLPASPLLIRAPTSLLLRSREGELRWPLYEPARLYGVLHDGTTPASLGADEGVTARAAALGLPGRLDPRVRVLAGTLATDARSGWDRLQNTLEWMRTRYSYSLDVGPFETADPLAEFLFEKKKGYCEYFATAAAVLLRLQGIPTRYVKGFAVGPQNLVPGRLGVGDHYVVREQDAHAWVEAYIEGIGWVEADPTPPSGFAEVHASSAGWLTSLVEALRVHAARIWARLRHEGFAGLWTALTTAVREALGGLWRRPLVLGAIGVGLLAIVSWRWLAWLVGRLRGLRRSRRARAEAFPGELGPLLETVERHWARRGRARPPASGLREHLEGLAPEVLSSREREASAAVVDACYRAAFAARRPSPEEVDSLRAAVTRLR